MAKITIYTMDYCGYCDRAKALLKLRGIEFKEIHVDSDDDAMWDELYKKSGMRTMPQIWAGDRLIGGYMELAAEDQKSGLKNI